MLNKQYTNMLQEKDVIFEIFQYATERAKVVGAENIYDFSLGNPSVPAPSIVNEAIVQKVKTLDPLALHEYSRSFERENSQTSCPTSIHSTLSHHRKQRKNCCLFK